MTKVQKFSKTNEWSVLRLLAEEIEGWNDHGLSGKRYELTHGDLCVIPRLEGRDFLAGEAARIAVQASPAIQAREGERTDPEGLFRVVGVCAAAAGAALLRLHGSDLSEIEAEDEVANVQLLSLVPTVLTRWGHGPFGEVVRRQLEAFDDEMAGGALAKAVLSFAWDAAFTDRPSETVAELHVRAIARALFSVEGLHNDAAAAAAAVTALISDIEATHRLAIAS